MANEEVQEEQEKNEAANTEDDMDSLMDELEEQQAQPKNIEGSEDLSSLVTDKQQLQMKIWIRCLSLRRILPLLRLKYLQMRKV